MYRLISDKCAWIWNNQKGNSVTVYQILNSLKVKCTSPCHFVHNKSQMVWGRNKPMPLQWQTHNSVPGAMPWPCIMQSLECHTDRHSSNQSEYCLHHVMDSYLCNVWKWINLFWFWFCFLSSRIHSDLCLYIPHVQHIWLFQNQKKCL